MQIIESTVFGVRSACIRLEAIDGAPSFVLFPMIHVADKSFYTEVADRLGSCDLVLCEGVKSPTASLLTSSYRFFANNPRLGLVSQKTMKLGHLEGRLINVDVSGERFEKRWSELPILLRFSWPLAALFCGLYLRYFGTRAVIASYLGMNLRKSRREILESDDFEEVKNVLLSWRDRNLIDAFEQQRLQNRNANFSIAVLFGARHMRAVIHHLLNEPKPGYRVVNAEWMTVFTL